MSWKKSLPQADTKDRLNPSRAELRALERQNKQYPVDRLVDIPFEQWPVVAVNAKRTRVCRCQDFLVQIFREPEGVVRLSIMRTAFDTTTGRWKDGIGWDDLQQLKKLAGYGDKCAVELYPPDANIVNVANIRHLFILPEPPSFMWTSRPAGGAA